MERENSYVSDINIKKNKKLSYIASKLSVENIFVHPILPKKIKYNRKRVYIIPCGVNLQTFYPIDRDQCRQKLGFKNNERYILFSSSFDNKVKNYPLAMKAINVVDKDINLIELRAYSREKVNLLMIKEKNLVKKKKIITVKISLLFFKISRIINITS